MVVHGHGGSVISGVEPANNDWISGRFDSPGVRAKRSQKRNCGVGATLDVRFVSRFSTNGWNLHPFLEFGLEL
jgi:hypothetical protein